jgi:uncharacterized repeat protein (TIGR03809 family)
MPPPLIQKWQALAERRRDHFIDLYESGQWRNYYGEADFRSQARAAFDLAEHWQKISQLSLNDIELAA